MTMLKKLMFLVPAFCLAAAPALAMSHGDGLPAPEGAAVKAYVTGSNPYQEWPLWPGKEELYPGTRPHGALLTTYVNQPALDALEEGAALPAGSIIVKENYTPDKKLAAVTVMFKKEGYNAPAGDYFWLKYAPDGQIQAEGKVDSCIGCHRAAKGGDWLFTNDSM